MPDRPNRLGHPDWLAGLTHKDWLIDGHPIRGDDWMRLWEDLDWSKAWVDAGPSVAGNPGPYWHVPRRSGDTSHRLYPRLLTTKWGPVARQAMIEWAAGAKRRERQARQLRKRYPNLVDLAS